jgi:hypothetical protein
VIEERLQGFRADRPGLRHHVEGEPLDRRQPLVGQRFPIPQRGDKFLAGTQRAATLEADLRTMVPQDRFRLDVPGWFGT